ncbi:unnamed protein product [Medioppia subpectinata]|uniref:ATPase V1 complex subunit H C-terminal domain-containing protein n=1 Tax=Medioppia subpectinata TaxID=1979941 RepID=A0A7R9KZG8_9ACAR|nr:unnamed protein product [Medioppia subpectinata]CAG2112764.1 unnamed protein product [Medioppia subpectinata]
MQLLTHEDPNVRYEALLCVQKLMVQKWEYLGKQLEKDTGLFRGHKTHPLESLLALREKYGSVYTFFMGSDPFVFIFDIEIAKRLFNKTSFCGRQSTLIGEQICSDGGNDIIFCDYGQSWHTLRNAFKLAVRKYQSCQHMPGTVKHVVDAIVGDMVAAEAPDGHPFDPKDYIESMFYCVVMSIAFGKMFTAKDPDYRELHSITDTFFRLGDKLALIEFVPILRLPLYKYVDKFRRNTDKYKTFIASRFAAHVDTYRSDQMRDFCDALIAAKLETIDGGNEEAANYLTDQNISLALWDVFVTATDDTQFAFNWMLLLLANCPAIQCRLRAEIADRIGHRMAAAEDLDDCHYANAFIAEALRYRNSNPLGVPHRTLADTDIDGLSIPANTTVVVHQFSILNDPKYWPDGHAFRPDRFLDSEGRYIQTRPEYYVPFGVGRRKCLGDRLAINELFLVLVAFLQSTRDYDIVLATGEGTADLTPDPQQVVLFCTPKPYEIVLKSRL